MAGAGVRVDESRLVPGLSADSVSNQLASAMTGLAEYHCALVGPGTHKVVRSVRRRLPPLSRRTEVCTVTVIDAPLGAVVTTIGLLAPEARTALDQALAGRPPTLTAPSSAAHVAAPAPAPAPAARPLSPVPAAPPAPPPVPLPPPLPPAPRILTVPPRATQPLRPPPPPPPPPPPAPPPPAPPLPAITPSPPLPLAVPDATVTPPATVQAQCAELQAIALRLDNGQAVLLGAAVVVVGRNPSAAPSDRRPNLVAIDDPGHTVSKTHFACWRDERGLWLEDRHSTNGTAFTDLQGRLVTVTPGAPTRIPARTTLVFGDHRAEVAPVS